MCYHVPAFSHGCKNRRFDFICPKEAIIIMGVHLLKNIPYFSELTIEEMINIVASSQK